MQGLPVGQQCGERQGLVRLGFLAFGCGIDAFCHVAHDRPHGVTRLGKRKGAATPEWDSALLPTPVILREIRLAAARRYPHSKPALLAIENEHVALAFRAFQTIDAIECELHSGPPADPARRHSGARRVASCQEGMAYLAGNKGI